MSFGQYVQLTRDVFSVAWPPFLVVSGFITALMNRLSPETKARLVTGRPYLAAALDVIAAIGWNSPQLRRGASGMAHGGNAPANVEVRRVVDSDEDIDGVTLTPAQPLLPAELRAPGKASEHFVLVQSKPPPPSKLGVPAVTVPPQRRVHVPDFEEPKENP